MKKNLSEAVMSQINKMKKELSKDKLLELSKLNNTSLNQSQIQSTITKDLEKPIKFKYLNQRVQIPTIYYERVEYVKEMFNNEELGFIVAYAPLPKISTTKELGKYFKQTDTNYIPPYVAHGTGCKTEKNLGYGVYVAKCQNTPFRTNCKSLKEINEEFKKLLRIKVSVIDNNFDVTKYSSPVVPYFLDIKNHLTGETICHNNLNFNPVFIQTNDGLVFNTNITSVSYRLDFNEKLTYERGNTSLLSGWYFLITNLGETYTRTYPKFQEAIANVGGTLKAITLLAQVLNYLFNQWTIILDIQLECEKLDLDYSFFGKENVSKKKIINLYTQIKRIKYFFLHYMKILLITISPIKTQ